jgi:hypothetical protein
MVHQCHDFIIFRQQLLNQALPDKSTRAGD